MESARSSHGTSTRNARYMHTTSHYSKDVKKRAVVELISASRGVEGWAGLGTVGWEPIREAAIRASDDDERAIGTATSQVRREFSRGRWIRARSALDARHLRARPGRYHKGTDHQAARLRAPFHPCPRRREKREEVDAMADLALFAAALQLLSSVIVLVAVIVERLPIRKDREP